jgi:hypothetical protein
MLDQPAGIGAVLVDQVDTVGIAPGSSGIVHVAGDDTNGALPMRF